MNINMNTNININIKRYEKSVDSNKINKIAKLYNLDITQISKHNINNYYINNDNINIKLEPMFKDIKEYDFFEPIMRLTKITKSNYYNNLIKSYNISKTKIQLDELNKIHPTDKDEIMLQYIKCRPNVQILTLFDESVNYKDIIHEIEKDKNANIYYVKQMHLTYDEIYNLMDQLNMSDINKKINKINKLNTHDVVIIIYEINKNKNKNKNYKKYI